jgi:multiple antibiotic resistance protein
MIQKFFLAFIPVFVAIDPIGLVAIFTGLGANASPEQRKRQGFLGIVTALCVAVGFMFLGEIIFDALGITDADFQVAGGLILLRWPGVSCSMWAPPAIQAATNSELYRLECR